MSDFISIPYSFFHRFKTSRWFRRILIFVFLVLFFILFNPVERLFEWILVYETDLQPVDVVLVNNVGSGISLIGEWYREGLVKEVLILRGIPKKYQEEEPPFTINHQIRSELQRAGIPAEQIHSVTRTPTSMIDVQKTLRHWIHNHGYHSYLTFCGLYSSRLVKMCHDDTFPEGDIQLVIHSSKGNTVMRKEILHIHNTLLRMLYWKLVYCSHLDE